MRGVSIHPGCNIALPFDKEGFLRPFVRASNGRVFASPYVLDVSSFAEFFGFNAYRRKLIRNLVRWLEAVAHAGLRIGAVWVGGSYIDSIVEPADMDVLIQYSEPAGGVEDVRMQELLDTQELKRDYALDATFVRVEDGEFEKSVRLAGWLATQTPCGPDYGRVRGVVVLSDVCAALPA